MDFLMAPRKSRAFSIRLFLRRLLGPAKGKCLTQDLCTSHLSFKKVSIYGNVLAFQLLLRREGDYLGHHIEMAGRGQFTKLLCWTHITFKVFFLQNVIYIGGSEKPYRRSVRI